MRAEEVRGVALAGRRFEVDLAGLQLTIDGIHALDRAADAHRAIESRATIGKLLLHP